MPRLARLVCAVIAGIALRMRHIAYCTGGLGRCR